jgi:hypothetical protein
VDAKTPVCTALVLLACAAGLSACGETNDQREARQTVTRFYEALKRHDARTACGLVSPAVADSMLRSASESGKPCVAGLRDLFRRVAASATPRFFDSVPSVATATVHGNHAIVVIRKDFRQRRVALTRVGGGWRITGSPD